MREIHISTVAKTWRSLTSVILPAATKIKKALRPQKPSVTVCYDEKSGTWRTDERTASIYLIQNRLGFRTQKMRARFKNAPFCTVEDLKRLRIEIRVPDSVSIENTPPTPHP